MQLSLSNTEQIRDYLLSFDIYAGAPQERQNYIAEALQRFLFTLEMVPQATEPGDRLLELGASPYYLTLLLLDQLHYEVELANYFGESFAPEASQIIQSDLYAQRFEFRFRNFNAEKERFPYQDSTFSTVLCCEIIEHLTIDPTHMLSEIHRVLIPGGHLVITTPNVLNLGYLRALAKGRNFLHPYSGYGVYGRHQREYTLGELTDLVEGCGYEIVKFRIEDLHPAHSWQRLWKKLRPHRRDHLFVLARRGEIGRRYYPPWLYISTQAIHRVADSQVTMGWNDVGHLGLGWWDLEVISSASFRWTEQEAHVTLRTPSHATSVKAEVCAGPATLGTTSLTLGIPGLGINVTKELKPDHWDTVVLLLKDVHLPSPELEVVLQTSSTRSPRALGLGDDGRDLGVMVRRISVD